MTGGRFLCIVSHKLLDAIRGKSARAFLYFSSAVRRFGFAPEVSNLAKETGLGAGPKEAPAEVASGHRRGGA